MVNDKRSKAENIMAPLLSDSETTSAMSMISELRKQRVAIFLSRGAMGQEVSFSFVSFLLDKQKKRKRRVERKDEVSTEP